MSLENMTSEEVKFWHKGWRDAFEAIAKDGLWRCPLCRGLMPHAPKDYNICPCCDAEFGYSAAEQAGELLWIGRAAQPEAASANLESLFRAVASEEIWEEIANKYFDVRAAMRARAAQPEAKGEALRLPPQSIPVSDLPIYAEDGQKCEMYGHLYTRRGNVWERDLQMREAQELYHREMDAAAQPTQPEAASDPKCICGHIRNDHGEEQPYECYRKKCDCKEFTYPIAAQPEAKGEALDYAGDLYPNSTVIRNNTIEEIASFVETHYCIMDPIASGKYKTVERPKHPCEPLAKAIRGLAAAAPLPEQESEKK